MIYAHHTCLSLGKEACRLSFDVGDKRVNDYENRVNEKRNGDFLNLKNVYTSCLQQLKWEQERIKGILNKKEYNIINTI